MATARFADRLGPLLGRAHEAHRAHTIALLEPLGLSPKGYGALALLVEDGPRSQRALAARQGIDRTTMVAVVDELESEGFVERRRDPGDRRSYALHATRSGRAALDRAHAAVRQSEEAVLAPLRPAERRALVALLRRVVGT